MEDPDRPQGQPQQPPAETPPPKPEPPDVTVFRESQEPPAKNVPDGDG